MPNSVDARFEEVARLARQVQDAVERVRARAAVDGVRVEVAFDGRIITLVLPDSGMAQSITRAHERAYARARERVAALRREFTADPTVAAALRRWLPAAVEPSNICVSQNSSGSGSAETPNPYALPFAIGRRYGVDRRR
ncbi:hypothetical protein ACWEOI_02860 [Nocardia sp. NPDC004340]